MSKTHGPWSVGFREPTSITLDGPQGPVAFRVVPAGMPDPPMHLIANAPAMLKAAQQALDILENGASPGWGVAKDILRMAIGQSNGLNPGAAWPFPSYKKPQP